MFDDFISFQDSWSDILYNEYLSNIFLTIKS